MIARLAILLCVLALPLRAEEIVADLSQNRIAITANFDGSEILIFGAIKRQSPIDTSNPLSVIVAISGPDEPLTVRRKSRALGIWINTAAVNVDRAPSFYAVSTTGPLRTVLTDTEDLRRKITIRRVIRSVGAPQNIMDPANFSEALIRLRERNQLYQLNEGGVSFADQTLFRSSVRLPSNLVEGIYTTRIFLTRDGHVVSSYTTSLDVQKVGLERWIFNLAHHQPLYYGLLSILIAVVAGWGASTVFRYIRG